MIFVRISCSYRRLKTLTDTSAQNCKGDISTFHPYGWRTCGMGRAGNPITKAIFNGASMYLHPGSCAARKYLRFVQSASCYWRLITYCIEWVLLAVLPRIFEYCTGHGMSVLQDVCYPSTWANGIRIRWSSSPFHRNQITRLSGWRVPREQHTALHSWTFSKLQFSMADYRFPENYIIEALTILGFFPIFTSPRNIVTLSTTSPTFPHQPLSPKSLRSSLLWCSITTKIRVGAMMNERRIASESMSLLVLLPINSVSERIQYRSSRLLGCHCLHCQLSHLWLRPPKLVWRLQIENSSISTIQYLVFGVWFQWISNL